MELLPVNCNSKVKVMEEERDGSIGIIERARRIISGRKDDVFSLDCTNQWPLHRIVDFGSRIVFPLLFLISNIAYFADHLGGRKNLR